MLAFFRRFRNGLVESGRASRYAMYAIGEIILVVIGILVALQINKWNQESNEKQLEEQYLGMLTEEITRHLETYASHKEYTSKRMNSLNYTIGQLQKSKRELDADEFVRHLNLIQWGGSLGTDRSIYEDLQSTGNIKLIRDEELRIQLQEYYHLMERYNASIRSNNGFYIDHFIPFLMKYLSMGHVIEHPFYEGVEQPQETGRPLFELWDYGYLSAEMKEFENYLYFRRVDLASELNKCETLTKGAEEVLAIIETKLDDQEKIEIKELDNSEEIF